MISLRQIFVTGMHVSHVPGSVRRQWRHCDTLCTSRFVDDVTFSRDDRIAYFNTKEHGVESDVYYCLVTNVIC